MISGVNIGVLVSGLSINQEEFDISGLLDRNSFDRVYCFMSSALGPIALT